jgi:hypothetical protein
VSPDSAQLEALRLSIEKNPDPVSEQKYLALFPSNHQTFRRIFLGNDENFDELTDKTEEHLSLIKTLSEKYPKEVLHIWLSVATNGRWDADAVGMFQHQLIEYAVAHTKEFASALVAIPPKERASIIRFLADVENHRAYVEYPALMENLSRLGYPELHHQFAEVKKKRMSQHDH